MKVNTISYKKIHMPAEICLPTPFFGLFLKENSQKKMNEKRYSNHNRNFRDTDAGIGTRCQGNSYHKPPHPEASEASRIKPIRRSVGFQSLLEHHNGIIFILLVFFILKTFCAICQIYTLQTE